MPAGAPGPLLGDLGVRLPVLAAPMAGGPGTAELAVAAARAGSLGFLAGGYKDAAALEVEIARVRAAGLPFGVNLFAPAVVPVQRAAYDAYAAEIRPEAERLGVDLPAGAPREDDDRFPEKLDVLLADPPALVSFTFGIPPAKALKALRAAGSLLAQTVTSPAEAQAAADAGFDLLVVQSAAAGGHSGTFAPGTATEALPLGELLSAVAGRTGLPLLAAGGVSRHDQVQELLAAGASGALAGTALLLAAEAGTNATHRAALRDAARTETLVTRAFTGRPARGLRNGFVERHDAAAPLGYPAVHHLTSGLRRAAAATGEPELLHLWAGTGFASARQAPAAEILGELCGG